MIKDKNRFNSIIKKGRFVKDRYFVIYYLTSEEQNFSKFGVAVKKSMGSAVKRNRVKRQARSIIDRHKKLFKKGRDYIIMIRNECLNAKFSELDESLNVLVKGIN